MLCATRMNHLSAVGIEADHPGVVFGHGGAEADRLRAEPEELIGKPVHLNMFKYDGPPKGRKELHMGSGH